MKIAVPVLDGSFCAHFGGADAFALIDVDLQTRTVAARCTATPPPHEHGVFPTWLRSQGVTTVLAGGMGPGAVQMLEGFGIEVVLGLEGDDAGALVTAYLSGELRSTGSTCGSHGNHGCHNH